MEDRFGDVAEDGSNSYLLCNINPIKTACHLLMLLDQIKGVYSMTEERANSLTDKINSQGVSVLTKLFFPRQMKY